MKKFLLFVIPLAAVLFAAGCSHEGKGETEFLNFKKLDYGKAVYQGEEEGLRRYVVTLFNSTISTVAVDNYAEADILLSMELIMDAAGEKDKMTAGEYSFSEMADAGVILNSPNSTLCVITASSYGEDKQLLTGGAITVNEFNGKYEIKGEVDDEWGRILEFTFYGEIVFEGTGSVPGESSVITFEDAALSAESGGYSDILWGMEKAEGEEGAAVYNGLLYGEGPASFGSYYAEGEYGAMWGGFAISSNRNPDDLGMDYSNQFSVYAPAATKFAIGYVFGEYGGSYANPVIEFSEPVKVVGADIANANKTYHYCLSRPTVGEGEEVEDLWVDLVAEGYAAAGGEPARLTVRLAEGKEVLSSWETFDFSALGEVTKIEFSIESNDMGEWGLNVPAFFCIDNITVE